MNLHSREDACTNQRKKRKRSASKKRRSNNNERSNDDGASDTAAQQSNCKNKSQSVGVSNYPYPTDYNDHFETPLRAYTDILPLMQRMTKKQTKTNHTTLTIYDPYFCTGRAASLLEQTFGEYSSENHTTICIKHEKRDFYKDIRKNNIPRHDILVTNPPYSGNHKERCLEFAVKQLKSHGRPFFLLMPNYVASKEYFRKAVLEENIQSVFVAPSSSQPYEYDHPEGTGHETPPFQSVWFCGLNHGKDSNAVSMKAIKDDFLKFHSLGYKGKESSMPRIAESLPDLIRMGCVSGEKRKNPRQRKKMRRLAMQRANQSTNK